MKKLTLKVEVEYTEPLLATASGNLELHEEFIASKAPDADKAKEELEALPKEEQIEKASTVFHRDEKGLFLFDYHWRGFFKECIGHMCELGEFKKLSKWTFRKAVDGSVFVMPRRIYFTNGNGPIIKPDGTLQRPLRATTMQGERVALVRSEKLEPGAKQAFQILLLESANTKSVWSEITLEVLKQCLELGQLGGHGQWRSGGYGRFIWREKESSVLAAGGSVLSPDELR